MVAGPAPLRQHAQQRRQHQHCGASTHAHAGARRRHPLGPAGRPRAARLRAPRHAAAAGALPRGLRVPGAAAAPAARAAGRRPLRGARVGRPRHAGGGHAARAAARLGGKARSARRPTAAAAAASGRVAGDQLGVRSDGAARRRRHGAARGGRGAARGGGGAGGRTRAHGREQSAGARVCVVFRSLRGVRRARPHKARRLDAVHVRPRRTLLSALYSPRAAGVAGAGRHAGAGGGGAGGAAAAADGGHGPPPAAAGAAGVGVGGQRRRAGRLQHGRGGHAAKAVVHGR